MNKIFRFVSLFSLFVCCLGTASLMVSASEATSVLKWEELIQFQSLIWKYNLIGLWSVTGVTLVKSGAYVAWKYNYLETRETPNKEALVRSSMVFGIKKGRRYIIFRDLNRFSFCGDFNLYGFPLEIRPDCYDSGKSHTYYFSNLPKFFYGELGDWDRKRIHDIILSNIGFWKEQRYPFYSLSRVSGSFAMCDVAGEDSFGGYYKILAKKFWKCGALEGYDVDWRDVPQCRKVDKVTHKDSLIFRKDGSCSEWDWCAK